MNQQRQPLFGTTEPTAMAARNNTTQQTRHVLSGTTTTIPRGPYSMAGRLTSKETTESAAGGAPRATAKANILSRQPLGRLQTNIHKRPSSNAHTGTTKNQKPSKDQNLIQKQRSKTQNDLPPSSAARANETKTEESKSAPAANLNLELNFDAPRALFQSFEDANLREVPEGVYDVDRARTTENGGMDSVKEGFFYMLHLERLRPISHEFPYTIPEKEVLQQTRSQKLVDERMRIILVDWIIQCAQKLNLRRLTTYLGIWILDKFIDECNSPSRREACLARMNASVDASARQTLSPIYVSKQNLQLVGISAMVIATKYEEIHFPILEDWVYLSAESIQRSHIVDMEIRILKALDFDVSMPSPIEFLRRFSKVAQADQKTHIIAKFGIETSLYSAKLARISGSMRAAAALYLALRLNNPEKKTGLWTNDLSFYSQIYLPAQSEEFYGAVTLVAKWLIKTISDMIPKEKKKVKAGAVYKKYCSSENMNIALEGQLFGCRLSHVGKLPAGEKPSDAHVTVLETGHVIRINPLLQNFANGSFSYTKYG